VNVGTVWEPTADYWESSRLQAVMGRLGTQEYDEFYALSIARPDLFWASTLADIGHEWMRQPSRLVEPDRGVAWPEWFPGGLSNVAHNALFRWLPERRSDAAVISVGELASDVMCASAGIYERGVRKGDRVALLLPYDARAATAVLALASLGAIAVPMFTGFAAPAIAQRLVHSGARFIITSDSFIRAGRRVELAGLAHAAAGQASSVTVLGYEDLVLSTPAKSELPAPMTSADPLVIAYTSGTTGAPKGAVHSHVGLPVKICQELTQIMDLRRGSVLLRLTDLGWVGGVYTILSGLMAGATLVMYSGSPSAGRPNRILELAAQWRVTHLAISPTWARMLRKADDNPTRGLDLDSLRLTSSVGEPWDPATYEWYFRAVGRCRLPIVNHSGGTEVGNLLACVPVRPIVGGTFNTAVPGVAVDVVDESGRPLIGQSGDLVVRQPFLGMTQGLWKEPERYERSYWARHPGLWDQGDLATRQADGLWTLDGRSDDRIKVSGRGIMPAEVEGIVIELPGVTGAAAVAVPDERTGSALALLIETDKAADAAQLATDARNLIRAVLGPAFTPRLVFAVSRLPRTQSGKVLRSAIRTTLQGRDVDPSLLSSEDAAALRGIAGLLD
jgi:acetyl-CoA synthetase